MGLIVTVDPYANNNVTQNMRYLAEEYSLGMPDDYIGKIGAKNTIISRAVLAGENLDVRLAHLLNNDPEAVDIFAGFDLAGRMYIGNGLILKQLKWYKDRGCTIHIPLVDYEAASARNVEIKKAREIAETSAIPLLEKLGFDKNEVYIRSKIDCILDYVCLFSSNLSFEEPYGIYRRQLTPGEYISALIMAADILRLSESSERVLTVYGIDEMPHIKFTNYLARKYGIPMVSSTFSKIISGLVSKKMSKSQPEENIFLDDTYEVIKRKTELCADEQRTPMINSVMNAFFEEELNDNQSADKVVDDFAKRVYDLFR